MARVWQLGHILFGAAFTVVVCFSLGNLLLWRLRVSFQRHEYALFSFLSGSALLSLAVFLLCVIQQARVGIFLLAGGMSIAGSVLLARRAPERKPLATVPRAWAAVCFVVISVFFVVYFLNALAPEISPDGSGYHLGNVSRILQRHGFVWDYHSMYSYLSEGLEMLFVVAFSIGRHSAAALVHFAFLTTLPLLVICYGRRFGFPSAALFAAVLVYASPVLGKDGTSAYNDLAVAAVLFGVFYLLQVWDQSKEPNLLILIGLLSGFAYAIKYPAVLALPFAAAFVLLRLPAGVPRWRPLAATLVGAAVLIAPWVLRNWIWVGNPLAPFFNAWFPNPYYHPGMEKGYLADIRQYPGLRGWWQIPVEITMRGASVPGILGPVFLLSPLALLALRNSHGRRLLCAAAVFAIPAFFNAGPRFLIPSVPFLSLALGVGLANLPGALPAIALAHAVFSWPAMAALYCAPGCWRIDSIPVAAALRKEPEPVFLKQKLPDYELKELIEREVPPDGKIFSLESHSEAYIHRTFVVHYESAEGNLALEILTAPLSAGRPTEREIFAFPPVTTRGARVVQSASSDGFWTIAEMRVYFQGRELRRSSRWRVSAWPNGWEVPLAFDNRYVTRWSSWQSLSPGMFVGIDFGDIQTLDQIALELAPASKSHVIVEALSEGGAWRNLPATEQLQPLDTPEEMRSAATRQLKARGIGYLLVNHGDFLASDLRNNQKAWGIVPLAAVRGLEFYRIQ
ncbi:MAG TPA: hypothetical protein VJ732_11770 [Bryobacteraceae bacterium]|nr:hypothetical protein [Bryobacteraceae bacterium]